jgi:hypothetical protein
MFQKKEIQVLLNGVETFFLYVNISRDKIDT